MRLIDADASLKRFIQETEDSGKNVIHINTIKRILQDVDTACDVKKDNWVPCSERLPEDEENVLVWFEYFRYGDYNRLYQTYGISYVYDGKWSRFVNGSSGWKDLKIIAWQPLPESYKE